MTILVATRCVRSRDEPFVEFGEDTVQLVAEEAVDAAEAAALAEGDVVEVVRLDAQAGRDVVPNDVEPATLLGRERGAFVRLLGQPRLVALLDRGREGGQRRGGRDGVAHQGDEVGQLPRAATPGRGCGALLLLRYEVGDAVYLLKKPGTVY